MYLKKFRPTQWSFALRFRIDDALQIPKFHFAILFAPRNDQTKSEKRKKKKNIRQLYMKLSFWNIEASLTQD